MALITSRPAARPVALPTQKKVSTPQVLSQAIARLRLQRAASQFEGPRCPAPPTAQVAPTAPAQVPGYTSAGGRIINQKLYDYLQANPQVKTVQDLVNQEFKRGGWTAYANTCAELGLNANEIARYRSASLSSWAALPPPSTGDAPKTIEQANEHFITQYYDPKYNPESTNAWSTNCGPTSLAMVLRTSGKMPEGLNAEQQIDYARALMYPALAKTNGRDVVTKTGETVRVLDMDKSYTNVTTGTQGAQSAGFTEAEHQTGWDALDAALDAGDSLMVEGNISGDWRKVFANHKAEAPGSYQNGGNGHFIAVLGKTADGKYLVADPMYTGGTVAMSREELNVFFKVQGTPSFVDPTGDGVA